MPKVNQGPRLKWNEETRVYFIHWTDTGRSKRRSTGASDRCIAEQVLAAFLTLDAQAERKAEADGPLLVMDVLGDPDAPDGEDYWHEHILPPYPEGVADKERPKYDYAKLHAHFGHMAVKDIMPADVRAYANDRRAGRLGRPSVNHTISRELSTLNAAINHAVKEKRLPKEHAPFIKLPGTSAPRDRWLRGHEGEALIAAAAEPVDPHLKEGHLPRIYIFNMIGLEAAGRKTSILDLQRKQIDLQRNRIDFNKPGRVQTKKRRPIVKISSRLRPVIEKALLQIPDDPDAYLLGHPGCIRTAFENCVVRAGLGHFDAKGNCVTDVTPHVLRHTKATWMAIEGIDMFKIASVLGDSVATVIKTYAHHHPDYQDEAVEAGAPKLKVVGGTAA